MTNVRIAIRPPRPCFSVTPVNRCAEQQLVAEPQRRVVVEPVTAVEPAGAVAARRGQPRRLVQEARAEGRGHRGGVVGRRDSTDRLAEEPQVPLARSRPGARGPTQPTASSSAASAERSTVVIAPLPVRGGAGSSPRGVRTRATPATAATRRGTTRPRPPGTCGARGCGAGAAPPRGRPARCPPGSGRCRSASPRRVSRVRRACRFIPMHSRICMASERNASSSRRCPARPTTATWKSNPRSVTRADESSAAARSSAANASRQRCSRAGCPYRHAQLHRHPLQLLAEGEDLVDVVQAQRRHDRAAARDLDDQALLLEDAHRLPQRWPADVEHAGEPVLHHPVAGPELPAQDHVPQRPRRPA